MMMLLDVLTGAPLAGTGTVSSLLLIKDSNTLCGSNMQQLVKISDTKEMKFSIKHIFQPLKIKYWIFMVVINGYYLNYYLGI